jgi:hypothetical protein
MLYVCVVDMMMFVVLSDVVLDPLLTFRNELKGALFISFILKICERSGNNKDTIYS